MTIGRLNKRERAAMALRLKAARYTAGHTVRGVAAQLGVAVNSVVQWENGTLPGEDSRAKLAALYGVDEVILFAELAAHQATAAALLRPPA